MNDESDDEMEIGNDESGDMSGNDENGDVSENGNGNDVNGNENGTACDFYKNFDVYQYCFFGVRLHDDLKNK